MLTRNTWYDDTRSGLFSSFGYLQLSSDHFGGFIRQTFLPSTLIRDTLLCPANFWRLPWFGLPWLGSMSWQCPDGAIYGNIPAYLQQRISAESYSDIKTFSSRPVSKLRLIRPELSLFGLATGSSLAGSGLTSSRICFAWQLWILVVHIYDISWKVYSLVQVTKCYEIYLVKWKVIDFNIPCRRLRQ